MIRGAIVAILKLARLAKKSALDSIPRLTPEAIDALCQYDFPGNVRELKNAVERSVYRSSDPDARIDRIVFDPFANQFQQSDEPAPEETSAMTAPEPDRTAKLMSVAMPIDLKDEVKAGVRAQGCFSHKG